MKILYNDKSKTTVLSEDDEGSYKNDNDDCLDDENEFKGALKITKIKNRRYIRMPNFAKRSV